LTGRRLVLQARRDSIASEHHSEADRARSAARSVLAQLAVNPNERSRIWSDGGKSIMSRVKFGLVSVLAMLAALVVCGVAASGASAVEWELTEKACNEGKNVNFCYEKEKTGKLFEFKGTGEFEVLTLLVGQVILLESELGGSKIEISCKAVAAEHGAKLPDGLILQPEPLVKDTTFEFGLVFKECVLEGAIGKKCKVPVEKATNTIIGEFDLLATNTPDDNEVLFKPKTPPIFIEIPFENNSPEKCPATIVGTRNVTGEILCFIDKTEAEALEDLEEHELICDPAKGESQNGKLFLGGSENKATLLAEADIFILNIGADLWSISNEA
jgi:hypothetical protein